MAQLIRFCCRRRYQSPTGRAEWLQQTCQRIAVLVGLKIEAGGLPIHQGLLVSNHLSYLDIIVLGSLHPFAFVAKSEVKSWPIIGWCARAAGTVFVRRQNRSDLTVATAAVRTRLAEGVSVMVFPEGTSSDGAQVLPFHPGVFESVAGSETVITPAWLSYQIADGDPGQEICYWGDMTFLPHLFRLLGHSRIVAHVRFDPPMAAKDDRKSLARSARNQVLELAATGRPLNSAPKPIPEFVATA